MKKLIFILGKNPEISLAEIICWMEAKSLEFKIKDYSELFAVIETDCDPKTIMNDLGGTIKIAEVIFSSHNKDIKKITEEITEKINLNDLFKNLPKKTTFGVSSYSSKKEQVFLSEFFKKKMREHSIKAGYMHIKGEISAISHTEVLKKRLASKYIEFLACRKKLFYLGKTISVHNPFEFRKRDIKRPVQRAIYSIPPRLSRILINLSKTKSGVILDPFCGIGGILQEAVLMGFGIRGLDNNRKCVEGCRKNLLWLKKEYEIELEEIGENISEGDARKLSAYFDKNCMGSIVSEPFLGPPLKRKPDKQKARKIIKSLTPLFRETIAEMAGVIKPGGRIVIVSPFFEFKGKNIGIDMVSLAKRNRCKIMDPLKKHSIPHRFPMADYEEKHNTLRKISILEKM